MSRRESCSSISHIRRRPRCRGRIRPKPRTPTWPPLQRASPLTPSAFTTKLQVAHQGLHTAVSFTARCLSARHGRSVWGYVCVRARACASLRAPQPEAARASGWSRSAWQLGLRYLLQRPYNSVLSWIKFDEAREVLAFKVTMMLKKKKKTLINRALIITLLSHLPVTNARAVSRIAFC